MADNKLPLFEGAGKFYVYVYRDPRPKKKLEPIYVGKGTAKRHRADIHWREGARNPLLKAILAKIKKANLEPIIEIVAWYDDEDAAFACEIALIAKYGRRDLRIGTLCNLSDGGEGPSGMRQNAEHIAKLADLARRRERPQEERDRISAKLVGHSVSDETKKKISIANTGRSLSDEHKEKLSIAQTIVMSDPKRREAVSISGTGRKRSAETCIKIGNAHRGMTHSEETKAVIRVKRALQKICHSEETKRKIGAANSIALLGRKNGPHSEETKQKIRLKALERAQSKKQLAQNEITPP